MARERLLWADALKGVLALVVVFGHVLQFGVANPLEDYVWNVIYSFHMPAFFAVSGFLAYKPKEAKIQWGRVITRRIQQLLIPFVVWSLIDFITHSYNADRLVAYIQYPDCMYWFLWTLFFICLIFTTVDWLSRKTRIPADIPIILTCLGFAGIMIVFNLREFGFQFIAYYFLFYSLGYFIKKYDLMVKNRYALIGLILVWSFLAFFWRMDTAPTFVSENSMIPSSIWMYAYRFATATIGVIVIMSVFARMSDRIKTGTKIVKLGVYSLGCYVVQLLFIPLVVEGVKEVFYVSSDVTVVLLSFVLTIFISVFAITLLKKNSITALFFLGKIKD